MNVSDIVTLLPASLDWMVLFNLMKLNRLFDDHTIKKMFLIPGDISVEEYSHAILTNEGTYLAPFKPCGFLIRAKDGASSSVPDGLGSLGQRFQSLVPLFPIDEADCLGLGEIPPFFPPVLMQMRFEGSYGCAKAIFADAPTKINYELLATVGVHFDSGRKEDDHYVAEFTVDLDQHIFSGLLSDFSKTGYCNAFFLQHGTVGPTLETGLIGAARDRVNWARQLSYNTVCDLARKSLEKRLRMHCQPPFQKPSFEFGDLVPLGFLLRCLKIDPTSEGAELGKRLEERLFEESRSDLWAFQSRDIPTATDSALVMLGVSPLNSIRALERFSDGHGGYYPQSCVSLKNEVDDGRSIKEQGAEKMEFSNWNSHWCQQDYATTCLIRFHKLNFHYPGIYPINILQDAFDVRSGLFFANPYLVDWCLALALQSDTSLPAVKLRERLLSEIIASMNQDHTFGCFDLPLSTALAILSLFALGYQGRVLLMAQSRLAQLIQSDGTWQASTPFYSSLRLPNEFSFLLNNSDDEESQLIEVEDDFFAISLYLDVHRMITTAVGSMALSELTELDASKAKNRSVNLVPELLTHIEKDKNNISASHPRYLCKSQMEYIARWALPPYTRNIPVSPN